MAWPLLGSPLLALAALGGCRGQQPPSASPSQAVVVTTEIPASSASVAQPSDRLACPGLKAACGILPRMADSIVALVAIVMVFGIPMSAIIGSFWLKAKRMQLASGDLTGAAARLAKLEAANADLKQRVETLETIVTADAPAVHARILVAPSAPLEPADPVAEAPEAAAKATRALP
jgi:hypothetical protein